MKELKRTGLPEIVCRLKILNLQKEKWFHANNAFIGKGKVQGVFYRASAKEKAIELGINGWIKNTREGDVEILASGNPQQMEVFVNWCRQGPSRARVEELVITEKSAYAFDSFSIIRDL